MKKLFLLFAAVLTFAVSQAQMSHFFGAPAKPKSFTSGRLGLATDSTSNGFHFLASVSTTVSTGVGLAGGAGVGYLWNKWDPTNQVFNTTSFVAAIGFANITNNKVGGVGGLVVGIPGTNGVVGVGFGRDFSNGVYVGLANVMFKFF